MDDGMITAEPHICNLARTRTWFVVVVLLQNSSRL